MTVIAILIATLAIVVAWSVLHHRVTGQQRQNVLATLTLPARRGH